MHSSLRAARTNTTAPVCTAGSPHDLTHALPRICREVATLGQREDARWQLAGHSAAVTLEPKIPVSEVPQNAIVLFDSG